MRSTVGSVASRRNRPAISFGVQDAARSASTLACSTGSPATFSCCGRARRRGAVEQLGWPRERLRYRYGTRIPTGAT
ncbi:hypothetical protein J8J17_21500, partial [Mycobacterium tuberculosis]|nr:hypothetical protein [Mycobacterium tuberculosis]